MVPPRIRRIDQTMASNDGLYFNYWLYVVNKNDKNMDDIDQDKIRFQKDDK